MRNLSIIALLALIISIGFGVESYADCEITGTIPGEGNIINCPQPLQTFPLNTTSMVANTTTDDDIVTVPNPGGIVVMMGTNAMTTSFGNDTITINGQVVHNGPTQTGLQTSQDNDMLFIGPGAIIRGGPAISMTSGVDLVEATGGTVTGTDSSALDTGDDSDTVEISGGTFQTNSVNNIITTGGDPDLVTITGGTFIGPGGFGTGQIITSTGEDTILISGGTFNGIEIDAASGDDTIHVTNDLPDVGELECGSQTDTLIFSMAVPEGLVAQLTADFLAAGTDGTLEVNGITYTWDNCEIRVPNFNGVVSTIELTPFFATNIVNELHTVTATVLVDGEPAPEISVRTEVIFGPNTGKGEIALTNSNGQVFFTYTSDITGRDTIISSFEDPGTGLIRSNAVSKTWILPPRNVPTLSEWGLIAMASLLGIVGFLVMRSRKAVA